MSFSSTLAHTLQQTEKKKDEFPKCVRHQSFSSTLAHTL